MHFSTNTGGGDSAARYIADQMEIGKQCLAAALHYLTLGWCPVPVCHPQHDGAGRNHVSRCKSPGKAPLVSWLEFQDRRPTRNEIEDWWRWWPWSGVGVLLGPVSNLLAIDLDGPEAESKLRELAGGDLPLTLTFRTPRPGRRLLYRLPEGAEQGNVTFPLAGGELKVQGKGSMTVMPPSRHQNGGIYEWEF
jgi:hypothetical protein